MKEWYQLSNDNIFEKLNSSINGINDKEAEELLKKNGLNQLPKKKKDSIFKIFLSEFNDPIVMLLIVAIILSFL